MYDGVKRVVINDIDAGDDYTVYYSSYAFPTLQSLTSATCDTTPTVYRDARDSQLYYVAQLADTKCWMLDNLKYKPNGDSTGTATGNFSATQVADPGLSNMLTVNGTSADASPNQDAPKYIDPIASTQGSNFCRNNLNKSTYNLTKCGLLYNYFTATAGTNPQTNYSSSSPNAPGSICPANWRLPSNNSGDYGDLDKAYNGTGAAHTDATVINNLWLYSGAFATVWSGYYQYEFNFQGQYGYFWSSTASSATLSRHTLFSATEAGPGNRGGYRYFGLAVRCVIGV
jgi:uncharacterized protein (TIGR02145 family)